MNKIVNHTRLDSGLHILHIEKEIGWTVVEVYTEKEFQHLRWWNRVLIKYNLK
jgi:hypothetical protein